MSGQDGVDAVGSLVTLAPTEMEPDVAAHEVLLVALATGESICGETQWRGPAVLLKVAASVFNLLCRTRARGFKQKPCEGGQGCDLDLAMV